MQDTVEILRAAIAHHQSAKHAEAEALCRTVVGVEPGHPRALYLYGLLLLDTGRPHAADGHAPCGDRAEERGAATL
jgi:protein O-GlcNAc transferase